MDIHGILIEYEMNIGETNCKMCKSNVAIEHPLCIHVFQMCFTGKIIELKIMYLIAMLDYGRVKHHFCTIHADGSKSLRVKLGDPKEIQKENT